MTKDIYSNYAIILNVAAGTFTELTFLKPYESLKASPDLSVIAQEVYTEDGLLNNFYTRGGALLLSTRSKSGGPVQCISSDNEYAVFSHEGGYEVHAFSVVEIASGKITHGLTEFFEPDDDHHIPPPPERYLGEWFPEAGENQFWTAFRNTREII